MQAEESMVSLPKSTVAACLQIELAGRNLGADEMCAEQRMARPHVEYDDQERRRFFGADLDFGGGHDTRR